MGFKRSMYFAVPNFVPIGQIFAEMWPFLF